MPEQYLPAARTAKLLVRELADETLVYDEESHRAHCLNRTAALVWGLCDGKTTVARIAQGVGERLSTDVSEDVVLLALDRLVEIDLLSQPPPRGSSAVGLSRRGMMRKLGLAAASLPLIMSVASPAAAQAQSPCTEENCPPPMFCCGEDGSCHPASSDQCQEV